MGFFIFLVLFASGILLLGHLGLPEKPVPFPSPVDPDEIMPGAESWRFDGNSGIAFVVCHGFGDSAFNTKPLGEFLHGLGHTAIGVLLPGHGSKIEDMEKSRYSHWLDYLERTYLNERSRHRKIFLVGFSMGGSLALHVAAKNADTFRPAGIITISSPAFFNGFFNGHFILHQPILAFTGIARIFRPVVRFKKERPESSDRLNPWLGYRLTYAMDALHSFKRGLSTLRRILPRISDPYCNIMAANDRTVSAENQTYIYGKIQSREKRAYMFIMPPDLTTMHALLTHKGVSGQVFHFIETFINDTLGVYRKKEEEAGTKPGFLGKVFGRMKRTEPEDLVN